MHDFPCRHFIHASLALAFFAATLVSQDSLALQDTEQRHTGVVPAADLRPTPQVLWKYTEEGKSFSEIIVFDGIVMGLDRQGTIHALSAETGKLIWQRDGFQFDYGYGLELTRDPEFDVLLVGCDLGVTVLDRKTGKLIWEKSIDQGVDGPTCTKNRVLAASSDGKVYCLELKTGKTVWKHDYLSDRPDDPEGFDGERARFTGRPARPQSASNDGKNVYFSVFDQCRIVAVNIETGKRSWATNSQGWMRPRPVTTGSRVFVASQDKFLYSLAADEGNILWKFKTGSYNSASGAVGKNNYYFGSNDSFIYALDIDMGTLRWKFKTQPVEKRNGIYAQCQLVGDHLLASTLYGRLYLLDKETGKEIWNMIPAPKSRISGEPQVEGNTIFLATGKMDAANGESCIMALRQQD